MSRHWLPQLITVTWSGVPVLQALPHQQSHESQNKTRRPGPKITERAGPLQSQEARVVHQNKHNYGSASAKPGSSERPGSSIKKSRTICKARRQLDKKLAESSYRRPPSLSDPRSALHLKSSLAHGRPMHAPQATLLSNHCQPTAPQAQQIGPGKGGPALAALWQTSPLS